MCLYKSGRHALFLSLVLWVCSCLLSCSKFTIPSSCASVSVCGRALNIAKFRPPPTLNMAGLAILAVPLIMRAVSHMSGSGDIARAAPAALVDAGNVGSSASPGCTIDNPVALDSTLNVTLGDRRYLLYFPINYKPDQPAPLVLSYHGGTRTAETQQALDLLSTTFFNQDYIVVYPNGINVCSSLVTAKEP